MSHGPCVGPARSLAALLGSALLGSALLGGCAADSPRYATRLRPSAAPRLPPGVSVERPFAVPTVEAHDERMVVLVPPLDVTRARRVVDEFFSAVQRKDSLALDRLLAPQATQQLSSGREFRSARDYWRRRLARHDYSTLAGVSLYRAQDLQIHRADDGPDDDGGAGTDHRRPTRGGELGLTVPLLTTHAGNTRLFGPEITFIVVQDAEQLVIARIMEDFQLL